MSTLFAGPRRYRLLAPVLLMSILAGSNQRLSGQMNKKQTVIERATEQFESAPLKTVPLGSRIFMFSGDGGNVVAVADDGSTLLIDSGVDSRTSELSDAILKATSLRPITRLVNTHWHFDHTGGNLFFATEGVAIIAQENVRKELLSPHKVPLIGLNDGPYPVQAAPTQNYATEIKLQQGPESLTLANYGPAHTNGDSIIYIAPANIVVVGDIFSNPYYPIIDLSSNGSIDGIIHTVEEILARSDAQTRIVPGHGPIATRPDLEKYHEMLVQVRGRIQSLIASGKTMQETVDGAPTKEFDDKWGSGYVPADIFTAMVFASLSNSSQSGTTRRAGVN